MLNSKILLIFFFVCIVTQASAQWNVTLLSDDIAFSDVLFFNEDTGFIGGSYRYETNTAYDCCGAIIRTHDGGINWDTTSLATRIRAICFIDKDTGFAASNHVLFYKTVDGGDSWQTVTMQSNEPGVFTEHRFTSVYFKNSLEGYMSGHTGSGSQNVFRTFDGGQTWESKIMLANTANAWLMWAQASFPTQTTGYIGNLFKTVDGGVNWYNNDSTQTNPAPGLSHVQCTDFYNDKYGCIGGRYVVGLIDDYRDACIGVTYNGGINWNYHYFSQMDRIWEIEIASEHIIHAAAWPGNEIPGTNTSTFITSFDSGNTWHYQAYSPDTFLHLVLNHINSISENVSFAVGGVSGYWGEAGEIEAKGVLLKTENAGGELLSIVESSNSPSQSEDQFLHIFPNPASSSINIKCNITIEKAELFDISGKKVQQQGITDGSLNVNVSSLSKGTYFVKLSGKEKVVFDRFIKL
jgi:hypothetical protein